MERTRRCVAWLCKDTEVRNSQLEHWGCTPQVKKSCTEGKNHRFAGSHSGTWGLEHTEGFKQRRTSKC